MSKRIWLKGADRIPSCVPVLTETTEAWISGRSKVKTKVWLKSEYREISEAEARGLREMEKMRPVLSNLIHKRCTHEQLRQIAAIVGFEG